MAESATFALKAGVWFRRGRLFIVSPDSLGTACPLSGRNSTYRPVQISAAGSDFLWSPEWTLGIDDPCCAAVPNKPRRLLDWSAPCACRRTAALRHNERQQAFPGQAF